MGRAPCCSKVGLHKGPWTAIEDKILTNYIQTHGEGHWRSLPKNAGLLRCGKSCRLRWMNYLRPDIKRGNIGTDEEDLIIRLHSLLGNRWSLIAGRLPGRTDNEIKNYWNSHLSKKLKRLQSDPNGFSKPASLEAQELHKRKKKKKNQKTTTKESKEIGETIKIKVHLPKPIRLASFPNSWKSRLMEISNGFGDKIGNGSSSHADGKGKIILDGLDLPCPDFRDGDDHDLGLDGDFQLGKPPEEVEMLEKLYEEYLELLKAQEQVQLDSFAESLWA
ncbi:uncharacterized protein LOC143887296 [Tasmannia lanceolata]|uniref:uncharacterized protein LOC143887296 n=1 Tax=Tasmannia lanceolata TaxID=3420 RepID=UPI0040645493